MMKDKLNMQERLLKYVKKTKPNTTKHVLILLVITVGLLTIMSVSASSESSENTMADAPSEFTAIFTGDIMMGRNVQKVIDQKGLPFIFQDVENRLKEADFVTGNFENPVLDSEKDFEKQDKNIHLFAKSDILPSLKELNFTVLNLANNHAMDYQQEGLMHTLEEFSKVDIDYVGAGINRKEATDIHYKTVNDVKIATLGISDVFVANSVATKTEAGIASARPSRFIPRIGDASRNADLTIVHVHWGEEYDTLPSERQRELAKAMANAGADIIIGHHPHVLQPVEIIDDTVVFYSLGNFVFDQGWSNTRETALITLKMDEEGIGRFFIEPMLIKEASPRFLNQMESYYQSKVKKRLLKHSNIELHEKDDLFYFDHPLVRRD